MWLSNRDFAHLFERAVNADPGGWPAPAIVVNGMSDNTGMAWSLDETRRYLGYQPLDDVNVPVAGNRPLASNHLHERLKTGREQCANKGDST